MAKRGRKPGDFGQSYETGREQSAFGKQLHIFYKAYAGKKLSQMRLAQMMGIPAPTLTLMLQEDEELARGERLYTLFKNLAQLLKEEQSQATLFEEQAKELLDKIDENIFSHEKKKALLWLLIQELIAKREYKTRWEHLPFLGRDKDIQEIIKRLVKEKLFLTIVGVPGVGKSELAWQVKEQLRTHEDFFTPDPISFDNVKSAEEVEQLITNALSERHKQHKTLLVLNDCEQIANNSEALDKINKFYNSDQFLSILATSRVLLPSEKYPDDEESLSSLAVPENVADQEKQLESYDAIQLFCESARRMNGKFKLTDQNASDIAKICIGLGGLPLAMIIAGSLIRQKNPKELYQILLDRSIQTSRLPYKPPQDRLFSLQALIDVSYNLLGEQEQGKQLQALFRRLGLFINECEVEAIAAACSLNDDLPTDPQDATLTNMLAKLASHHLIIYQDNWIHIAHVTLRDYVARRTEKKEITNHYLQLAQYYCQLALRYAVFHNTGELREMMEIFYNEKEIAVLERQLGGEKIRGNQSAWSESLQKQKKDLELIYWYMSKQRLFYIERESARLLGEDEDKASRRIKVFGLENYIDIDAVINEVPAWYFMVRRKVERDRSTPYNPAYFLLEALLLKEDFAYGVYELQERDKLPKKVVVSQVQFGTPGLQRIIVQQTGIQPIPLTMNWIEDFTISELIEQTISDWREQYYEKTNVAEGFMKKLKDWTNQSN